MKKSLIIIASAAVALGASAAVFSKDMMKATVNAEQEVATFTFDVNTNNAWDGGKYTAVSSKGTNCTTWMLYSNGGTYNCMAHKSETNFADITIDNEDAHKLIVQITCKGIIGVSWNTTGFNGNFHMNAWNVDWSVPSHSESNTGSGTYDFSGDITGAPIGILEFVFENFTSDFSINSLSVTYDVASCYNAVNA